MRKLPHLLAPGAAALAAMPAGAALPPNYQRLAELRPVPAHPGVAGAFSTGEPIDRIEHLLPDFNRVTAGRCHVNIAIVDLPTPADEAGPRRPEARPGEKLCSGATGAR